MSPWRPVDAIANWLGSKLTAKAQLRMGILLVIGSLPLYVYAPFSGEPVFIYTMSAAALTLTGIGIVVTAQVLLHQKERDG